MSDNLPAEGIILHIWPGQWGLPSFEPLSLAAILYLQLAIPGKFRVAETPNPDSSPTGQLPYLVHEQHVVSSLPSIIKYVSDLRSVDHAQYPNANLDVHLTPVQKAQKTAWVAHAESHLGDLVAHALYSVQANWTKMTGVALASMYPVPQRYYVPRRIRDGYFHKLDAAGLWNALVEEKPEDKPFQKEKITSVADGLKKNNTVTHAFEREKVLEKARVELDIYQELLGNKTYVFGNDLTSLDIVISAFLILLLNPPYPDPLLKTLLAESYPSLASYAQRLYSHAFAAGQPEKTTAAVSFSLRTLLPSWPTKPKSKKTPSPEDAQFDRMRWGFFGLAAGVFVAYFAVVSRGLKIEFVEVDEEQEEDEEKVVNVRVEAAS